MTSAAGVIPGGSGASGPSAEETLAEVLEANRQLSELASRAIEDNAVLREQVTRLLERDAERESEREELLAQLAVLQKIVFGRSSEKSRPEPGDPGGEPAAGGPPGGAGGKKSVKRGPGRGPGGGTTRTCRGSR